MLDRIARLEVMLKEPKSGTPVENLQEPAGHIMAAKGLQMMSNSRPNQQEEHLPLSPPHSTMDTAGGLNTMEVLDRGGSYTAIKADTYSIGSNGSPRTALNVVGEENFQESLPAPANERVQIDLTLSPPADKGLNSIASPENSDWEYHGPRSFLSICSKLGIDIRFD